MILFELWKLLNRHRAASRREAAKSPREEGKEFENHLGLLYDEK